MSGDGMIEDVDSKISDVPTCRNLHAENDTFSLLSGDVQRLIEGLTPACGAEPYSSSISLILPNARASRGPSRAKRRAWHRKSCYQRGRCCERLRPWQVDGLFEADSFARTIGLPLNTFLTISWTDTSHGGTDISRRFGRATKAMGEWLRRRSIEPSWVFVHENPGGTRPNAHMLIHIPGNLLCQFQEAASRWFDAMVDGVHVRKRRGPRDHCLRYMVKGTDLMTAKRVGARARNQGGIDFKRCGWTENLGLTARERHLRPDTQLATGFR